MACTFSQHLEVCRGTGRPVRQSWEGWQSYEKQIRENPGDACGNGAGGGERGIERAARSYLQQESVEDGGGAIPVGAEAARDWREGGNAGGGGGGGGRGGEGRGGGRCDARGVRGVRGGAGGGWW